MVQAQSPCPPPDVLELLAQGRGSTDDVHTHVSTCDSCRLLIDEMKANEDFLHQMRPALRATPSSGSAGSDAWKHGSDSGGIDQFENSNVSVPGYNNLVEISRGGQGIVYRAVHALTKRKVAIKTLLRGAYASAKELHRFEREIEIVAALRHPNIVTVFDSGVTHDQRPFVVMEYIHGVPLDKYVKEKIAKATRRSRMLYEPHLRLFAKISHAVQHAHSRGVIHRDLKPGNILVDDTGEPHIVDFGMARSLSLARGPTPTMTHEFGGTLAYASPEQVAGDPERIDVRTDVYSLGVILYEMLTAKHPYAVNGSIADIVRNIEQAEPERPTSVEPAIGGEVETIVLKALAKEPDRRYCAAGDLGRDIEAFLDGRPISARSDSAWYLVRKMARRHKGGVVAGCAVALLLAGCTAAAIVADRAHVRLDGARQAITKILGTMQIARGDVTPRDRFRNILDASAGEVAQAFDGLPAEEAGVRESIGHGYWEVGESARAEEQFKRVLELREAAGAPLSETAPLRVQLARICAEYPANRFADAEKYLDSTTLQKVRGSGDKRLLAEVLRALGSIRLQTDPATGGAMLEEARGALVGLPDAADLLDAVDDSLAAWHLSSRRPEEALKLYTGIYERMRTRHGDRHLETATRLDSVADCEFMLGKHPEALAHYLQVHDVYQRLLIAPDTRLINSLLQLAAASKATGDDAGAAKYRDQAETMRRDLAQGAGGR